ncbi:MAG: enoyl-CoA hydratase/isomerase family protein [Burkholderiaceae bacterium]|nr:enoyl-CoA hydratase/isomerase family protein [Burkholderiaceae bacterium]
MNYKKNGNIAVFTLDNPPVNVTNPSTHKQFHHHLQDFLADDAIKVGIWTAAGTRAFCAGDDIKTPRVPRTHAEIVERYLGNRSEDESLEYPGWELQVMQMQRYKPIIAAINGPVLGQGFMYLTRLTDIRIATPNATFGLPEIKYAMPGAGGMLKLGLEVPHAVAMWLALTGEPLDAESAQKHGLINEIVPQEALMERAYQIAGLIARHPSLSIRTEMEAYYQSMDMTRDQAVAFSAHLARLQRVAFHTRAPLGADKDD